jgi:ethanolamine utilization microcompartment shell protein EutS
MSADYVFPEKLASLIHHYREALAPDFGLTSNSSIEWTELTPQERSRMIAATRLALLDLRSATLHGGYVDVPSAPEFSGGSFSDGSFSAGSEGKECGS